MAAGNRIIGSRIVERRRSVIAAPATILAYPIERQRAVVAEIAASMMRKRSATTADECIAKALRQLTAEMCRQGIPAASIRREVHAMEAQVRAAVWRLMFPWVDDPKKDRRSQKVDSRRRRRRSAAPADQPTLPWIGGGK
jgi:hypothetical protein